MAKSVVIAAFLLAAAGGSRLTGRTTILSRRSGANQTPGQLLDKDYTTSTGATVPNPGVPQGSGPTALDRKIQQEDNKIDNSICKGC